MKVLRLVFVSVTAKQLKIGVESAVGAKTYSEAPLDVVVAQVLKYLNSAIFTLLEVTLVYWNCPAFIYFTHGVEIWIHYDFELAILCERLWFLTVLAQDLRIYLLCGLSIGNCPRRFPCERHRWQDWLKVIVLDLEIIRRFFTSGNPLVLHHGSFQRLHWLQSPSNSNSTGKTLWFGTERIFVFVLKAFLSVASRQRILPLWLKHFKHLL